MPVVEVIVNNAVGLLIVDPGNYRRSFLEQRFFYSVGGSEYDIVKNKEVFCLLGQKETIADSKYFKALIGPHRIKFPMWILDFQGMFNFVRNERYTFAGVIGEDFFREYSENDLLSQEE